MQKGKKSSLKNCFSLCWILILVEHFLKFGGTKCKLGTEIHKLRDESDHKTLTLEHYVKVVKYTRTNEMHK